MCSSGEGKFFESFELHDFPFDSQDLTFNLSLYVQYNKDMGVAFRDATRCCKIYPGICCIRAGLFLSTTRGPGASINLSNWAKKPRATMDLAIRAASPR